MAARIALPLFLLFALCCFSLPVHSQEKQDETEFIVSGFELETQPGGYYYSNFIENLAPDAVWLSEESNGFGLLDRPRVYFAGDSWTQFNWDYAGYPINSALDDGAPALQIPFLAIGAMSLRSETPQRRSHGFSFVPRPLGAGSGRSAARVMLSTAFPNLGGYLLGLAKLAVANHASLRDRDLYETRRKLGNNFQFDIGYDRNSKDTSLLLAAGYVNQQRRFNDFNERDAQFEESGELLQMLGRWQRRTAAGNLHLDLAVNAGRRGNLFAEVGRYPQETYIQDKSSWLAAASWAGRAYNLTLSWLHERQELQPNGVDAGKDLQDIDGQAFVPFEKQGLFRADTLAMALDRKFRFSLLGSEAEVEPFLDFSAVFNSGHERPGKYNALYFAGQPYLVYRWQEGSEYRNQRRTASAGTLLRIDLGARLAFLGRFFLHYQGLDFRDPANDLDLLQPGGEAGFSFRAGKRTTLSLSFGVLPYEMRAGVSDFLEKERPGAAVCYWNDGNRDGLFQEGEQGALFALSGGDSHTAAETLKPSLRQRLELFVTTRVSANFQLDVKGLYKRIRRPLWASFAGEYGHSEEIDGKSCYIMDRPVTAYELGNSPFSRDPFYAQFLLRIHGEKARRWYFSFSFMAHMGMGTTAFGNGPEANDIGVISESQAFPNSWINGYGRVDGDRAFVGKVFFGCYLSKRLFLGGGVKYRDGDPFAFIDACRRDNQWVLTYQTIKAEDKNGKKGGPREDCIWDFNFKLGCDMTLFGKKGRLELSVFNLLDFGG
ncbi:MAG: hypothetical protein PHX05_07730, partial [Acidobacteriota bacterium]|nr:hypothetical protein [Acidobacteriota bacterium]